MKKIICFLFILSSLYGFGQNLVQNPSFEQYSICPDNPDQLSRCQFWNSFRETPDYLNTCSSTTFLITPPSCWWGFQYPHSGNAYAGFSIFAQYIPNNRELIGSPLLDTLIIGQKYFISFYINLGGSLIAKTTIASNKMGVKFSTVPYSYSNPAPINNTAHFYSNSIITDTVKWTRIKGSFIADSAYSYIIIGNFFDDSLTDTINLATINKYAYYFIDDVCVTTDSLFNENWTGIREYNISNDEIVTIYPNPCSTKLTVKYNILPDEPVTISILDITGKVILQAKTEENEFIFNVEKLAKGLYLVKVETESGVALTKFTKE
jgi:OmpA-OmpF porin, OOP family